MTSAHQYHVRPRRIPESLPLVYTRQEAWRALCTIARLILKIESSQLSSRDIQLVTRVDQVLNQLQAEGLLRSFQLGDYSHDCIHVSAVMPDALYTRANRLGAHERIQAVLSPLAAYVDLDLRTDAAEDGEQAQAH